MTSGAKAVWLLALMLPAASGAEFYSWGTLAELRAPLGVAGAFAGVSNGVLVVAGGAHFHRDGSKGHPQRQRQGD